MRIARETFLAFLRDNLDAAVPINFLHREKDNPEADRLQTNAVNVSFDAVTDDVLLSSLTVFVDVINDDELTAQDWVEKVIDVLKASSTPRVDYSNPDSPQQLNGNVFWERKVKFRPVRFAENVYSHYSALLTLNYQ